MPLAVVTAIFLMCGLSTTLNSTLIPHLKDQLTLGYTEVMLIQLSFYGAYLTISPVSEPYLSRIGYKKGIFSGLSLGFLGALGTAYASSLAHLSLVLASIFTLGAGAAILQVTANTYTFLLGDPLSAPRRLMLAQAFTCIGMVIAPLLGSFFVGNTPLLPFFWLYILCSVAWITVACASLKLPKKNPIPSVPLSQGFHVFKDSPNLQGCFFALACYVGCEVCVGSFLIKYLQHPEVGALAMEQATRYASLYWGGIMLGRFVGPLALRYIDSHQLMMAHATAGIALVTSVMVSSGGAAITSILALGLCNSIMFPCIFGDGLAAAGPHKSQVAGVLCMAQIGGALFPLVQGWVADSSTLHTSFCIPLVCYGAIFTHAIVTWQDKVKVTTSRVD